MKIEKSRKVKVKVEEIEKRKVKIEKCGIASLYFFKWLLKNSGMTKKE